MSWIIYALLSAFFASLVAIFGKIGIKGVSSNLAVAVRTVIIVLFAWGIVLVEGSASQLKDWRAAYLDFYRPFRYCHRAFLAVLLPRFATWPGQPRGTDR